MDWSNEQYVRLYIRDTKSWLKFRWEGQCLLMMLLRKVDRAGILDDIDDPVDDLSLMTGLPAEHVEIGLERLLARGTVIINGTTLVIPNFIEAQETPKSDKQRQRESRERRRTDASVTKRDASVTNRDEMSQVVTGGHSLSQGVTLSYPIPHPNPNQIQRERESAHEQDQVENEFGMMKGVSLELAQCIRKHFPDYPTIDLLSAVQALRPVVDRISGDWRELVRRAALGWSGDYHDNNNRDLLRKTLANWFDNEARGTFKRDNAPTVSQSPAHVIGDVKPRNNETAMRNRLRVLESDLAADLPMAASEIRDVVSWAGNRASPELAEISEIIKVMPGNWKKTPAQIMEAMMEKKSD